MRDFRRLQNDPPSGVTGAPMDNNILAWQVGRMFLWGKVVESGCNPGLLYFASSSHNIPRR